MNQREFVERTIQSIESQTYPNIEHIVIDGGSTDGTVETLRVHEGKGPLRWVSEPERGTYQAINRGLRLARGDIIACIDSGDAYPPWAIAVAVAALSRTPGVDVVYGDGLAVHDPTGRQLLICVPPFEAQSMAFSWSLVQPAVFFRRQVFEALGDLDDRLGLVGDVTSWLQTSKETRFARIDEVLAIVRLHHAAISLVAVRQMLRADGRSKARSTDPDRSPYMLRWLLARTRAVLWRRWLWLRFLRAARSTQTGGEMPWSYFASSANLAINPARVSLMFVPRLGGRFAWDAIRSKVDWLGMGAAGK